MCKVLDARERRGEMRGEIRGEIKGLKRGATQMHELVRILIEKGYQINEVLEMTSEEEAREKLYQWYGVV